ncbi:addiction module toxin RelE [Photorhabdus bodei]|uniref:type II toxin-antitoxin system RelE family toxin n=1 Tax=Photorhabdus bodei TaxID=2029681 RepID=UPI00232F3FE4|nr:type II toxin-antitoxin system RelE/ParE family toxin [Photorhabdus bodei]MDB6367444.1 addiction module toxin RelE [Photorhabdus bodei]
MIYSLEFEKRALKEWKKLGHPIKGQLKKKLAERLENPHVPSARLSGRGKKPTLARFACQRWKVFLIWGTAMVRIIGSRVCCLLF